MADEPPYLAVGTEVSAKYKGAFCEAKIRKVVRSVKCKVIFKQGLGTITVADDQIRGQIRNGVLVEARHPEKKEFFEATIAKVQDCSQYTVVFDDGDITTLRRTALCLKSGRHFAESETLDQLPLTHPEHFSNPVIGGRRGRRNRTGLEESSEDEEAFLHLKDFTDEKEEDIGRVVCVEGAEKKKQKDNWFPGLVVSPTAQDTVPIDTRLEYLVRSFKDGRYYTVPKKEAFEFTREVGLKVENGALKAAVEKAYQFLDKDELPPHWDRDSLFGLAETMATDSDAGFDYESSDDEPREEKDHFVAQLYKFMDDSGTPINKGPTIGSQDVDLYRLFKVVQNLGGFNRVTNHNNWKIVSHKMGFGQNPVTTNMVKQSYKKYLYSFEEFYRKLGCTMVNHPRTSRNRNRSNRSLIRDRDKTIKTEPKMEYKDKQDEASYDSQVILSTSFIKVEASESSQEMGELPGNIKQEKITAKHSFLEEPKIKIEPPDEKDVKCEVKENKKTPRQKKIRTCLLEQMTAKTDNNKTVSAAKDKKKRLFTRTKRDKDKSFVVKKSPIPSGTRQKRIIKDKEKTIVDNLKLKTSKIGSSLCLPDASEKTSAAKKVKDDYVPSKSKKDDSIPISLEEKKKGRKRKDKAEVIDEGLDTLPTYKTVSVGDKLKVYYGPKHDLKVTYEAKVLNIREEGSEAMYLVHYYGWNTRYDEWIKHSRVADNMSWVPGRPPKKSQQTPKGGRKRSGHTTKPFNDVSTKLESESDAMDLEPTDSCSDVKSECNITCSVPSFSDNKLKGTRAITRASNKRVASVSENEDYESDNVDIESVYLKKKANIVIETDEGSASEKRSRKRKSIDTDEKEHKSDDEYDQIKHQKLNKKVIKTTDLNEKHDHYLDKKSLKESDVIDEYPNTIAELNTMTNDTTQKFEGFDVSSDEENFLYIAEDETEADTSENKGNLVADLSEKLKIISDNPPKGRDFDLNQIRSELKGIETAVCSSVTPKTEEGDNIDIDSESAVIVSLKQEVEDVYEFKEPEPFEFESRKIADDKNKLQRRTLNRYIDESKHSPCRKKKMNSPTYCCSKKINVNEDNATREVETSETDYSGIETCEEAFDKICASPLRAATEVVPLFEEQVVNDHVEDNLEDDSQDRLIISERYSDDSNLSNTNQKESNVYQEEVKTTFLEIKRTNSQQYEVQIETGKEEVKDHFNKEDWKDEIEDEALNVAIQRAINQESSDDTSDGEILKVPSNTMKYDTDQSNLEQNIDSNLKSYDLTKPSSFKYEYDFTEQSIDGPVKIQEENVNNCEKSEEEIETEEIQTSPKYHISESPKKKEDPFMAENKDELPLDAAEEITMKEEVYENQYAEEKTIIEEIQLEEKFEAVSSLKHVDIEEEEEVEDVEEEEEEDEEEEEEEEEEVEDEDEEEQTLMSLLCDEEIIPGSPNPQADIQEEEVKDILVITDVDNDEEIPLSEKLKENHCINQPITEKEINAEDNTPPASPDSSGSSCPSPLQERELSPSSMPISLKNHVNDEYDVETISLKNRNSEEGARLDSRIKKSEGRSSVKKGRRPRKRSQETGKRKYSKSSRHHGSDSDDVYDSLRMTTTRESLQRPSRSGKYNFAIKLDPDLDSSQRIAIIQQTIQQLRRTYADVKAELAVIDRRRKKLRRRERENAANRFH